MYDGYVVWRDGTWHGGMWLGGMWRDGTWRDGTWRDGTWRGGMWHDGTWRRGTWHDGTWRDGTWHDGTWLGGTWRDPHIENRIVFMASMLGIVFSDDGTAVGYRSTHADGRGRHVKSFQQPEGEYHETDLPASGAGTCVKGIHVSSAATAFTYFGVDPAAQLWRVRFRREHLLDCDGQKARISGGFFEKIPWPWGAKVTR